MKSISVILFVFQLLYVQSQFLPDMLFVKGGSFSMGLAKQESVYHDEYPDHEVFLNDFHMSTTPITVAQYRYYCELVGKTMPPMPLWGWNDSHPIVNLNWFDAIAYTDWLSIVTGKNYRLPTEAEWEFAALGGTKSGSTNYGSPSSLHLDAWFLKNSEKSTQPVKQKNPNALGLYDMLGNVWEFCMDWYDLKYYELKEKDNPKGPRDGVVKVYRGGSWRQTNCRIKDRCKFPPLYYNHDVGFRVVYTVD